MGLYKFWQMWKTVKHFRKWEYVWFKTLLPNYVFSYVLYTLCIILDSAKSTFIFIIGVVEYLSTGGVETNHKDFKELRYNESLTNFSCNGKNGTTNGRITHGFKLKSAYESGLMPYTNYTFDFKVSFEIINLKPSFL